METMTQYFYIPSMDSALLRVHLRSCYVPSLQSTWCATALEKRSGLVLDIASSVLRIPTEVSTT